MKCFRCDQDADMMTTGVWKDGRRATVFHCFPHWDESMHETLRRDDALRFLRGLTVTTLDQPLEADLPPY